LRLILLTNPPDALRARRQANLAGTLGNLLSRAANRKLLPGGVLPVPTRFDAAADAPLVRILMQVPCRAPCVGFGSWPQRRATICHFVLTQIQAKRLNRVSGEVLLRYISLTCLLLRFERF
jgi:hypothetical protein